MDFEAPSESDYLTHTNPERFAQVVEFAERMVDQLEEAYDVQRAEGDWMKDFPRWVSTGGWRPPIHLNPSSGVPLVFGYTEQPGVVLRVGANTTVLFPDCGCDACDLQVDELCDELQLHVDAAISGGYTEELTRRSHRWDFLVRSRGRRSSHRRLRLGEWKRFGTRGSFQWDAWTRRSA